MVDLKVNGNTRSVDVSESKPLLWALREDIRLNGTKYGCGLGLCGACTVLVDGKAKRSCVTSVKSVVGKSIQTIEGMNDALAVRIKDAWKSQAVSQCGYCQTGQIMASYELIANREEKTPVDFREQLSNLCRCGTYNRIHHALETVVSELDAEEAP